MRFLDALGGYFSSGFHWRDIWLGAPLLLFGLKNTFALAIVTILMGTGLGTVLAVLRYAKPPVLGIAATLYIEFIRSIPLILFLVFIHYGILPKFIDHPNFLLSGMLAFVLFESAYIAEIIRGGLASILQTQKESARSLGLTYRQQLQYVYLPLAFRRTMPALAGQFISLIKNTSLASIVGIIELTRSGEIIYERTSHDFEILLFLAVVYWLICFSLTRISRRLEYSRPGNARMFGNTLPN